MTLSVGTRAIDPATWRRHALHGEDLAWVEKNCYIDVWIEVVHALGLNPHAMLPHVFAIDFEGDQWTFFKPPHDELRALYGIEVSELTVWRPLIDHARDHLAAGKLISTESDAWWLPDTAGTDYRRNHVKTTIVMHAIDIEREQLGYFHNTGYHTLEGEDFRRTFRLDHDEGLPLYAELIRTDRARLRPPAELRAMSLMHLQRHLRARPDSNPVARFAQHFAEQGLPMLLASSPEYYHAWGFATLRQLGAAFECGARYLRWLDGVPATATAPGIGADAHAGTGAGAGAGAGPNSVHRYTDAILAFDSISSGVKTLLLKCARAVHTKRSFDAAPIFDAMALAWENGMEQLDR